jgi:hypothetical protein
MLAWVAPLVAAVIVLAEDDATARTVAGDVYLNIEEVIGLD